MIDFHTHILPKMDDGSKNTAMSVEMLKTEYSQGVKTVIATPHFYTSQNNISEFLDRRLCCHNRLMEVINEKGITDIPQILLGAEVKVFNGIENLPDLDKLCIGDTKLILLEMPFEPWTKRTVRAVNNIINDRGLYPIIAHIERYIKKQDNYEYFNDIINMNLSVQMNVEFLTGFLTKRQAVKFLKDDIVQIISTDCHNLDKRPPNITDGFNVIEKKLGKEFKEQIIQNAYDLLRRE